MTRYVLRVELARTYERSLYRPEKEACAEAFATLHAVTEFPTTPHEGWMTVVAGTNVVGDLSCVVEHGQRRASILRTMTIARPVLVHAKDRKDALLQVGSVVSPWREDMPSQDRGEGWHLKSQTVKVLSVDRDVGAPKANPRFLVDFQQVIAPDSHTCGLEDDQAFELFRWMVAASANYSSSERYYTHHAHMSMNAEGGTDPDLGTVLSRSDLTRRIVSGVLSQRHDVYREWRADHGITPTTRMTIEAPTYGRRADSVRSHPSDTWRRRDPFSIMEASEGIRLATQLNPYHAKARIIQHVGVVVKPEGFVVELRYGCEVGPYASYWRHVLARSRGREPFVETFDRAVGSLMRLVPDWDAQIGAKRSGITRTTESEAA